MKKQVIARVMLMLASLITLVIACNIQTTNNMIAYLLIMIGVLTIEGSIVTPFNVEKSWRYKRWTK